VISGKSGITTLPAPGVGDGTLGGATGASTPAVAGAAPWCSASTAAPPTTPAPSRASTRGADFRWTFFMGILV
jgi:hypothetical protein